MLIFEEFSDVVFWEFLIYCNFYEFFFHTLRLSQSFKLGHPIYQSPILYS